MSSSATATIAAATAAAAATIAHRMLSTRSGPRWSTNYGALAAGWFSELSPDAEMWPHQCLSLKVEEVMYDALSEYQHVQVFRTAAYGTMLVLDGVIQITERDEHSYQEMIANIPLCAHPHPVRVALIGGGDGGVLREICRHPSVAVADHCEIDAAVCEVSRRFLPAIAAGLDDPRVKTRYMDGAVWLKEHSDYYDVIIVDSSDPVGPAASLFAEEFYRTMKGALREGGIICTQGECLWLHEKLIAEMIRFSKGLFKHARYAYTTIPTYPSGQIGFVVCSDSVNPSVPAREHPSSADLRYYTDAVHRASFVLPKFVDTLLGT